MKTKYFLLTIAAFFSCVSLANAQNYTVSQTETSRLQNKKVLLLQDDAKQKNIIVFQTKLRVNTEGLPFSYHSQDPRGRDKALKNICSAITVTKEGSDKNLCFTNFPEAIRTFEQFRDANYQTVPPKRRLTWTNELALRKENGKDVPCVLQSGAFKGYFGSLTTLKNGLTKDKGECDINNQVNPLTVPTLVLVGGENVVKKFGAKVGDLVVAYNPTTKLSSTAIIGDTGTREDLGEGSVALNMKLLGVTAPPTNKVELNKLSIENTQVLVAIIPASGSFKESKPYTMESIMQRVEAWQKESGFATPEKFIEFMKSFQAQMTP